MASTVARAVGTALLALTLAMVAIGGERVMAHGNPEISVEPNPAPTGGTVTIEGKEFEENDEVSLTLEGIGGSLTLGKVTTDAEGSFHLELTLPEAAGPGAYQIRAEGQDTTALTDFRITAAAGGGQPALEHERAIGFHRGGPATEVIALSIVMGLFTAAGIALALVRERAPR